MINQPLTPGMSSAGARHPTAHATPTGFALAVVVFLLFAIAMASATGYAVVSLEADMAVQDEERAEASRIARAGLERYFGEHLGLPDDTVTYAIGAGNAVITARRMAPVDAADGIYMYLVESEGQVTKLTGATSPASVTVRQYARLHSEPIARTGALISSFSSLSIQGQTRIEGEDYSTGSACTIDGEDTNAVVRRGSISTSCKFGSYCPYLNGSPGTSAVLSDHDEVYDTAGIRWDVLTDPTFPVDYDDEIPNQWTLPAGEYPVIRWNGNLAVSSSHSGRGVLIVTGELSISGWGFSWDGIVLAGDMANNSSTIAYIIIEGMLIVGLDGGGSLSLNNYIGPYIYYDACHALAASNALAYWDPLEGTFWEEG